MGGDWEGGSFLFIFLPQWCDSRYPKRSKYAASSVQEVGGNRVWTGVRFSDYGGTSSCFGCSGGLSSVNTKEQR